MGLVVFLAMDFSVVVVFFFLYMGMAGLGRNFRC